jgi:hypothetical protein
MSTILEDQIIGWRAPKTRDRFPPAERVQPRKILRGLIIVASVVAALAYFATSSQTAALVSGLLRDATRTHAAAVQKSDERPSPVVVFVRPSAREGVPLQP